MDDFKELEPTGREFQGPIETLVEYKHPKGLKRFAIEFEPQYRAHPELGFGLQAALGFISEPNVTNLIEVSEMDTRRGAFAFPTGTCWPLIELMRTLSRMGKKAGARAGLELCYQAATILHEANQVAQSAGLYCHGNLNPWRIMVKVDGQIQLIGYGLPQVDVLIYREEDGALPSADGLRYCPPERLEGNPEDVPGDILSLALIAFELMVGEPLYNGIAKEIHSLAINGNGPYRLFQYRDVLPESVIELLSTALKYDADARFTDANEFLWAVKDVMGLPSVDGMSLAEVVQVVRHAEECGDVIQGGKTNSMTPGELAAIRELLDAPEAAPLKEPESARPSEAQVEDAGPRWESASRARGSKDVPEDEPDVVVEDHDVSSSQAKRSEALRARLRQSKEERRKSLKERLRSSTRRPSLETEVSTSQKTDAVADSDIEGPDTHDGTETSAGEVETVESFQAPTEEREGIDASNDEGSEPAEMPMDLATNEQLEEQESTETPEEIEVSEKPEDAAAALLARLKSSQSLRVSQSVPSDVDEEGNEANVEAASDSETEDSKEEVSVAEAVSVSGEGDEHTSDVSHDQNVPLLKTPPKPSTPTQLGASGAQRAAFQVALKGYAARTVKLKLSDSVAATASRLGQALGGLPTDLSGQISGWYRIMQGGSLVDGAAPTSALDPNEVVDIVRVPGEVFHVSVVILDDDAEHRFQAPVSSGIPSAFLLSHLIAWLSLSDGDWSLQIDGVAALPMQTLMELKLHHGSILEVTK